jgi:hypothetical protein
MESAVCVDQSTYHVVKPPWRVAGRFTLRDMGLNPFNLHAGIEHSTVCAFWLES